jgi:hypothetical protein
MESCDEIFDKYYENKSYYERSRDYNEKLLSPEGYNIRWEEDAQKKRDNYYNYFLKCIKIKNLQQILYNYNIHFNENKQIINTRTFSQNLHEDNYYNNKNEYQHDAILFIDKYNKFMKLDKKSTSYGGSRKQLYNEFLNFLNKNEIFERSANNIDFFINKFLTYSTHEIESVLEIINDYYLAFFFFKSFLEVYDIFYQKKGIFLSSTSELITKINFGLIKGYNADNKNNNDVLEAKINTIIELIKKEVNKNINKYLLTPYKKQQRSQQQQQPQLQSQQQLQPQQPNHSQIIETKKNELKQKIEAIIGKGKISSIDDIKDNNELIKNIETKYKENVEKDNSIISSINESIKKHSQYTNINSCIQNQTTDPVYEIILTTNSDNYAKLSKSNIEELKKLLSEYNSLIEQQLSIPDAIEPPLTLTGIAGGSHNLRHSIDLIIQSFKKQRPSLNINQDLLYNCILSSSKKNKNKPLRKYNQRTKR